MYDFVSAAPLTIFQVQKLSTDQESVRFSINMKSKSRSILLALLVVITSLGFSLAQAQTNPSATKTESDSRPMIVDKVVANPEKFKGPINVSGRVAKLGWSVGLFALSCEDQCFSMPVKFSGTPPKPESNVIVHGQLVKESMGVMSLTLKV